MDYVAVNFKSGQADFEWEILTAFLAEIGFETFEETEAELFAYIPKSDFKIELIESLLNEQLKVADITFSHETIADKNWNEVWESNYDPVTIADRCLIRAPFHESNRDVEYEILIEPQMSFGTAHHETTAMMIEYVLEANIADQKILDMGSGTGILAILASMRGAKEIDAIDIDEWAYKNCLSNIEKNNITNVNVIQGDAGSIINKYDVIFANINLNILVNDMEVYSWALKSKGVVYFSGFYQDDLTKLEQKAIQFKLKYVESKVKNNWMAARFVKVD